MFSYIIGNIYYENYPYGIGLLLQTIPLKKCRVQHISSVKEVLMIKVHVHFSWESPLGMANKQQRRLFL